MAPLVSIGLAGILEPNSQGFAVIIFSVQRSKRGTGFVSFHLDKTKTPALSGEYIRNQAHGTHLSEF